MIIDQIVTLRVMLDEMEQDLGLDKLSAPEKSVYLAAQAAKSKDGLVQTRDIFEHQLTRQISRPTFFRCLKAVQNRGLLKQSDRKKTGEFKVL